MKQYRINNKISGKRNLYLFCVVLLLSAASCKKKIDFSYDNRPNQNAGITLNTRLVNLIGYREMQIGDKRLSSFLPPDREGYYGAPGTMRTTPYFPETGQLGTTFAFPGEFLSSDGYIRNIWLTSLSQRDVIAGADSFDIKDHGRAAMDYYMVRYAGNYDDSLFSIPRDITSPSDPTKFKIRILNLGINPDLYQRQGAMTLSFADGSAVNATTSNVARGAYSDYIELPYGSYQFKVLTADEREVPAKAPSAIDAGSPSINILNPNTATLMGVGGDPGVAGFDDSWLSYAPIKTYQPGGVYTIVVANTTGWSQAQAGTNGETIGIITNTFQIINDISEPQNISYARVQGVNTIAGNNSISWKIAGKQIGNSAYTFATGYQSVTVGKHAITATDAQGTVLAEYQIDLRAGDNITAWAYQKDGKTAISVSANNLSGSYNLSSNGNDGTYQMRKDVYPFWIRFMNFCGNLDDVTFTSNNGQGLSGQNGAATNVIYATQKVEQPYVMMNKNFKGHLLVYQSKPGVTPGNWESGIAAFDSRNFIQNIGLYKTAGKPYSEPGIYTVALMGGVGQAAPANAKIVLIKHNQ
jgi:hypothetical protein